MRGKASPYEVRCPRCDVSFPVGTRRCIHCGGPVPASAGIAAPIAPSAPSVEPGPFEPPRPAEAPVGDEASSGVGTSLLKLSGSLFWIIAVVIFSIARSCGEG
jgi:hypothetical protein